MEELTASPWALVAAVAGAVVLIRNGLIAVIDIIKLWKAPDTAQNDRITALEATTKELQAEANRIQKRLDKHDDGNRVTQIAILALLEHGIDGNNIEAMMTARAELQKYLINK